MVTTAVYIPRRGDLVWMAFSPQSGHEQSGRRPAVCMSPETYNRKVGLAIFCPVTSVEKSYPFEVPLPNKLPVSGVILTDQAKSMDWRERNIDYICTLPAKTITEALRKLRALL